MIILRYMTESIFFFFSSRRRHTRCSRDWSSDVCSSDLFQDAKFGLFIHWGVYSVLGDGEWVMETRPINRTDYAKRSEEHTSELQSRLHLVCRLLLEKKKNQHQQMRNGFRFFRTRIYRVKAARRMTHLS